MSKIAKELTIEEQILNELKESNKNQKIMIEKLNVISTLMIGGLWEDNLQ